MRYVNPVTPVLSAAISGTTPINGGKIDTNQLIQMSFQYYSTDATSAGTVKVQMSNDATPMGSYNAADFTPTHWSDIPSATGAVVAGVGAPILLSNMAYRWVRVVFTPSAGTGVANVQYFGFSV
jgi:hypothetical protein